MKRKTLAVLLSLAMIVSMIPTLSFAGSSDTWNVNLNVSKSDNPNYNYNGQESIKIGFGVQSDNLTLRKAQSIIFAVDSELFDLLKWGDSDDVDMSTLGVLTSFNEDADAAYEGDFVSKSGKTSNYWDPKVYYAKSSDNKIVYIKFEASQDKADVSVATETSIATLYLGLKTGKKFEDICSNSIRLVKKDEILSLGETTIIELTDGSANTQNYGLTTGQDTLLSTPTVNWTFTVKKPVLEGTVSVTGTTVVGNTLSADTSGITSEEPGAFSYQWYRGTNAVSGATLSTYTLTAQDINLPISVAVSATNCSGFVKSAETEKVEKKNVPAPAKPTATSITENSISINPIDGCEYRLGDGDQWQEEAVFDGLDFNKEYKIYARYKMTNEANASTPSDALVVKTKKNIAKLSVTPSDITYDGKEVTIGTAIGFDIVYNYNGDGAVKIKWCKEDGGEISSTPTDAGKYKVAISASEGINYQSCGEKAFDFEINKAPLTVTAKNKTITYGEEPTNDGVEYSGFVNGENESSITATGLTYNYGYSQYGNIGKYAITPTGITAKNYKPEYVKGILTVEPKEIGIRWNNTDGRVFGDAKIVTASATDLLNGDSVAVTVESVRTQSIGTNEYKASGLIGDKAGNYKLPASDTTIFEIGKATCSEAVKADLSIFYGTTALNNITKGNFNLPSGIEDVVITLASPTGFTDNGNIINSYSKDDFALKSGLTSASSLLPAATWNVVISSKNYNDINAAVNVKAIDKTPVNVDMSGINLKNKDYDGVQLSYTGKATVSGHTELDNSLEYSWYKDDALISTPTDAGTYKLVAKIPDSNNQYMGSGEKTVTIAKVAGNVNVNAFSKDYNGVAVTESDLTINKNSDGVSIIKWYNSDAAGEPVTTSDIPAPINVGTYYVGIAVNDGDNYLAVPEYLAKVTINKATPDIGKVSYSGAIYESTSIASASNLLSRENTTVPGKLALDPIAQTSLTTGSYNWTFTPNDKANYNEVKGNITLTVSQDELLKLECVVSPTKMEYSFGEALDLTGAEFKATFASGIVNNVTSNVTYDKPNANQSTISFSYTVGSNTKYCNVTGFTINKAEPATNTGITSLVRYNDLSEQTVDLSSFIPKDAGEVLKIDVFKPSGTMIKTVTTGTNLKSVKYTLNDGVKADDESSILAVIDTQNYNRIYVNIVVKAEDRIDPTFIEAEDITVTYTGNPIAASEIKGIVKFGDYVINGEWSFVGTPDLKNATAGTDVTVKFTPIGEDGKIYAEATDNIKLIINKAKVIGEPAYLSVESNGKTLADAKLSHGTISPLGGILSWELPETTVIAPNTAYKWTYTAPRNYESISGSAVLWKVESGGSTAAEYKVNVADLANGSISVDNSMVKKGGVVRLSVIPESGYEFKDVTVSADNGSKVDVSEINGVYSFIMPGSDVTASAIFTKKALPFHDVNAGDWFYDSVDFVYNNGIMNGVTNYDFAPDSPTTRAMLVTMLYRIEGKTSVTANNRFADVEASSYYAGAVAWASSNGIVNGYSYNQFGPNDAVTREQIATILCNYAKYKGVDINKSALSSLSKYSDAANVSSWAVDPMKWACGNGLINGMGNNELNPAGNATRAQVATLLMRYLNKF